MIVAQAILSICLLSILPSISFAQTPTYTAYRSSFPFVTSCPPDQYFDTALMQCSNCPTNSKQSLTGKFYSHTNIDQKNIYTFIVII